MPVACTSRPCTWSVVQSKGRMVKSAISDLQIIAPNSKRKDKTSTSRKTKGIKSTLYDARSSSSRSFNNDSRLTKLMSTLRSENPHIPALSAINENASCGVMTQIGTMPLGSLLSVHLPLMPCDFKVYCSVDTSINNNVDLFVYPPFPFKDSLSRMNYFLEKLPLDKKKFVELLKINKCDVDEIQLRTNMQADEPEWFELRKYRVTASVNNKIKLVKTEKGFKSLAKNLVTASVPNKFVQHKMDFGRYHEPISLNHYEKFMKSKQHHVQVENVGLVIDYANYVIGASPDRKIIDSSETFPYGIMEIKCSEEYKNNDPRDICFISKSSCLEIINDNICLKRVSFLL